MGGFSDVFFFNNQFGFVDRFFSGAWKIRETEHLDAPALVITCSDFDDGFCAQTLPGGYVNWVVEPICSRRSLLVRNQLEQTAEFEVSSDNAPHNHVLESR